MGNSLDGAYLWRDGRYTILNDAVASTDWTLTGAAAVSRGGVIAAQGTNSAGMKGIVLIDLRETP